MPETTPLHAGYRDLPHVVRQVAHDMTQPLQALRMILDLPGVVVDDQRGLSEKIDRALTELDVRLAQLQTLARSLDAAETRMQRGRTGRGMACFTEAIAIARQMRPDLWVQASCVRIIGARQTVAVPAQDLAWVVCILLDNALKAHPKRRVVIGMHVGGRRLWVLDDGWGCATDVAGRLTLALNGTAGQAIGNGFALARAISQSWHGRWTITAKPGVGFGISVTL